jgi:hypothetical protein
LKSSIQNRLTNLENKMSWLYANEFFEQWLQIHYPSEVINYWEILDTAPLEFRLECCNRAWNQMRKAHLSADNCF